MDLKTRRRQTTWICTPTLTIVESTDTVCCAANGQDPHASVNTQAKSETKSNLSNLSVREQSTYQEAISILPSLIHFESCSNYKSSSISNKNHHTKKKTCPFQETIHCKFYATLTPAVRILFWLQSSLSSFRLRSCRWSPILNQSTILRRAANVVFCWFLFIARFKLANEWGTSCSSFL